MGKTEMNRMRGIGSKNRFKDRHGGFGRDSWYLRVNVYP